MSDGMGTAPEPGGQDSQNPAQPAVNPAYGFPPHASAPGYGYPPPQDGYGYPPLAVPAVPAEPDWYALAEDNARAARRKRRLRVVFAASGVLVLAGIVTAGLLVYRPGGHEPSSDATAAAQSPAPGCVAPVAAPSKAVNDLRLGASTQVSTVDGHSGLALTLRGTPDGYAEVNSVVVDTCRSFTVSAVVRNTTPQEPRAAVSQGSDGFFSFYLGRGAKNQWVFKVQTAAESGTAIEALSGASALNQWTTLTGVYDTGAKSISLYVNGVLAMTKPAPKILSTNGPIEIGRARFKSHWVDAWGGSVADVQVWNRSLTPEMVAQVARTRSAKDAPAHATWFRF